MLCMCLFLPNSIWFYLSCKGKGESRQFIATSSLSCIDFLSGTVEEGWSERSDDFDHVVCSAHLHIIWKYPRWSALCQISSHQTCALILDLLTLRKTAEIYGSRTAYNLMPSLIHLNIKLPVSIKLKIWPCCLLKSFGALCGEKKV